MNAHRSQLLFATAVAYVTAVVSFCEPATARADTFLLTHGGQIHGVWLNRDEPASAYQIETESGGLVRLERTQVKEILRRRPAEIEFDDVAPTFRDTVEDQWKLAEWCRQRTLLKQREQSLRRIVELDPNVSQAWYALGYSQVGGRWVAKGDVPRENGLEFYKGRWRLKQEIQLLEERAAVEQAERDWQAKLKRLRPALIENDRVSQARAELLAIRDPHAVRPLSQWLAAERLRPVRLLLVEALAKIESTAAQQALVTASLHQADIEVFHACLAELLRLKPPGIFETYVQALRDENNERVNRAAYVLGQLGEKQAIGPLIDALITSHKITRKGSGNPEAMSATFGKTIDGSGQELSSGSSFSRSPGPTVQIVKVPNQEVLAALTKLAGGVTYGFDQASWKNWYGVQRRATAPMMEARREP